MPAEFVDSNVLLYLTSAADPRKAGVTEQLLRGRPMASVQVLNEFANVAYRKFKRDWSEIKGALDELAPLLDVHPLTERMHRDALRLVVRYRLQWWDSLLIAAALSLGCSTFYSEDMHDGLVVDGTLTVRNPFA